MSDQETGSGWSPAEKQLRDALLDEVSYALGELPGSHRGIQVVLTVLQTLEKQHWGPKAPADAGQLEYGQLYSTGGFLTFNLRPEVLRISPIAKQIEHGQMHGGKVGRRRVIVVQDWKILRRGAKK